MTGFARSLPSGSWHLVVRPGAGWVTGGFWMEVVVGLLQFRKRQESRNELTIRLYNANKKEESEGITFFPLRYSIPFLGSPCANPFASCWKSHLSKAWTAFYKPSLALLLIQEAPRWHSRPFIECLQLFFWSHSAPHPYISCSVPGMYFCPLCSCSCPFPTVSTPTSP